MIWLAIISMTFIIATKNTFNMICDAFAFGYAQGRKATKSELRKAAK